MGIEAQEESTVSSKLVNWWARLLVLENVVAGVGILIAAWLAVLGIKGNNQQQTLAATVALLTALALAQIVIQHKSATVSSRIESIESLLEKFSPSANPPLRTRAEVITLQEGASSARDILIIAQTAVMVLRQTEFFVNRISQGATIRLVVANPDNRALVEALGPLSGISREGFSADMRATVDLVHRIRERTANSECFQVRVFDRVPTLSLVMVDRDLPTGYIVVEMLPYQVGPPSRPHLLVTAMDNPIWYDYFRQICEAIWRDAQPSSVHSAVEQ